MFKSYKPQIQFNLGKTVVQSHRRCQSFSVFMFPCIKCFFPIVLSRSILQLNSYTPRQETLPHSAKLDFNTLESVHPALQRGTNSTTTDQRSHTEQTLLPKSPLISALEFGFVWRFPRRKTIQKVKQTVLVSSYLPVNKCCRLLMHCSSSLIEVACINRH